LIAVAVPVAGAFVGRMMAIDLAYQIRAGSVMLETRRLLDVDTFTFTVGGLPWLNQQWGSEVVLAAIHRIGGWAAIAIARGLLVGLVMLLLYRACRAAGAAPRTAALLSLGGWLVGVEIMPSMRPQLFGCILFATSVWLLVSARTSPKRLWWLPAVMVAWVNLHGSFALMFLLLGLAWLDDQRRGGELGWTLVAVGVAALAASAPNPYGIDAWAYAFSLTLDPVVLREVAEWGPPSIHTFTGAAFFASIFAVGLLFARRRRAVSWVTLLSLAAFGVLGLIAIRGVVWWALATPVILARLLTQRDATEDGPRPPLHLALAAVIVLLPVVVLPIGGGVDPRTGGPSVLTVAPERLVSVARSRLPAGSNVFVSQLYASWSEFSAPGLLVAVDPRIEVFPAGVWDDYFLVSDGREGWDDVLDRWGVDALLLEPEQAEGLLAVLPRHPGWELVAADAAGSLFVRR
jgi:xanthosine utilization system XapX-like protein